ncbi:MAG: ATP-binding protein [Planctomycetota bacterium JB042]
MGKGSFSVGDGVGREKEARGRVPADSRTRASHQALLAEFTRLALGRHSLDALLDEAVARIANGLHVELVGIFQVVHDAGGFVLRSGVGWDERRLGRPLVEGDGESVLDLALRSREVVRVGVPPHRHRLRGPKLIVEEGVRSGMSAAILPPERPWGVLGVYGRERREFTPDDVHFVESIANILADVIARSRIEDELRDRAREMSLLFRATSSEAASFPDALRGSIEAVCEITGWPIGHAYVLADDGRRMRSSGIWRVDDLERTAELRERTEKKEFVPTEGFIGTIWSLREPVGIPDVRLDGTFKRHRLGRRATIHGAFGFPVIVRGDVAAVLEFFSYDPISTADLPLDVVRTLGSQVGRALERNQDAESLRTGAERLSLALEAGGLAAWDWDLVQDVTTWSDELFRLLGHQPGDVEPGWSTWIDRLHPDDRAPTEEAFRAARERAQPYHCEVRIVRPDGAVVWAEARGRFSFGRRGKARRMYGVIMEVTERRRMESRLVEADRRKSAFLSTLGHELRNPLAALVHGVGLVERQASTDALRDVCSMMRRQARHMTRLLDDLLDIGRIERGSIRLDRRPLSVAESLERTAETVKGALEEAGQALEISVEPPSLAVRADPVRFAQIVSNLLVNAARYSDAPGRVRVDAREVDGRAEISVRDEGIGLTEIEMRDIFEPFFQSRPGSGGLGIGLSLVHRLAALHDGLVRVESEGPGRGSTFTLLFPACEPPTESEIEFERTLSVPRPLPSLRVLAVDDHRDSLSALRELLATSYSVEVATSGEEAIEAARSFSPHVVLLDIGLPGKSGLDVVRELRDAKGLEGTRWIAVTGFGDAGTESRILDAGFDELLLKPIDLGELTERLERHARRVERG